MTTAPAPPATLTLTLTRIRLNRRSQAVRRDLTDPQSLHQRVMLLAPEHLGDHARQKAGLLFRLEDATDHTPPTLFIQTHHTPDLTRLPTAYGTAETRDLIPMLNALAPGRRVRYRITANPSRRRTVTTGDPFFGDLATRHHDEPLHDDDALAWWHRKATRAGLTSHTTDPTPLRATRHPVVKPTNNPDRPHVFRHLLTRFDGQATITDPALLHHALLTGIGRGKAYGAGLLSLAPA